MRRKLFVVLIPLLTAGVRAWMRRQASRRLSSHQQAVAATNEIAGVTERYLLNVMIPLWVITGLLDYIWHRKTRIETTSGLTESVIHCLMMAEAGLPLLLGLFLEINAGVILLMLAAFVAHAGTAIWDVSFAVGRRKVTPAEQHIHSFLEVLPFCAVSVVICLHSGQFRSLFGAGANAPRFQIRRKHPPLSRGYIAGLLGAVTVNGVAYGEEMMRCFSAKNKGLEGIDTPAAARRLYGT